ncbi:MAG TPA: hypothetical protein VE944_22970 [Nostoc sp.]|uniref:hypothetical protein n=1 Tax=Nostoc sp. TaxID=1180 RepID=UPI002D3FEE3D|nr:hypothetical protein [Nostoc sp.]HYX17158.1 hypothetical protein [Nostoc sp.]
MSYIYHTSLFLNKQDLATATAAIEKGTISTTAIYRTTISSTTIRGTAIRSYANDLGTIAAQIGTT